MSEERITYDEFMTMFKFAPRTCYTLYDKAEKEIDRLNNIIDGLEKYLKNQMEYYKLDTDYYVEYKLTLDKLNKLKGDNK